MSSSSETNATAPNVGVAVNWSEELEQLHEESSRTHFLDVWTRRAMIKWLDNLQRDPVIADLGCSTGYLLEDLERGVPSARLVGLDGVLAGLRIARNNLPSVSVSQGDAQFLPFRSASLDAVVSANLLEHLPNDVSALTEIYRVLRPGGVAVIVVPRAPGLFDYYDRHLQHERRYRLGEMARKGKSAGFEVLVDHNLGSLLYPAFWLVKKRNRLLYDSLRGEALEARVASDIAKTTNSSLGALACRIEERLLALHWKLPVGIRGLTVFRRPQSGATVCKKFCGGDKLDRR